jgi:hypothetical protein
VWILSEKHVKSKTPHENPLAGRNITDHYDIFAHSTDPRFFAEIRSTAIRN